MRPAYIALVFLIIGLIQIGSSLRTRSDNGQRTDIARNVRRRTGVIFLLVASGLLLLDWLS